MLNGSQTGFGRTALIERGECMPSIDTFLQTAYQFIKALFVRVTKRMYRTAAVLMTGAAVVTVIAFNSVSFGGVGKNAASAHREYPDDVELTEIRRNDRDRELIRIYDSRLQRGKSASTWTEAGAGDSG